MTQVNPTCSHVSASSLSALKACPTRYRLGYREGLRVARDTESQRIGTNWHAMHELYREAINEWTPADPGEQENPDEPMQNYALGKVIEHINERYTKLPDWITAEDAAYERTVLITCFQAYLWYYQNDDVQTVATEVRFDRPLYNSIGLPLPREEVLKVGMIDRVIRWQKMVGNVEYKSTTRAISGDDGQEFWDNFRKNDQISMYASVMRDLAKAGLLPSDLLELLKDGEIRFGNTLVDAFRRPTIKPAALSQAETKTLIETSTYYGQTYLVEVEELPDIPDGEDAKGKAKVKKTGIVRINGEPLVVEPGAKGYAVCENLTMFAARLLAKITDNPETTFVRREIVRTAAELKEAEDGFFNAYQVGKFMEKYGTWYQNGAACRATFKCQYIPICFGPGPDAVCDGKTTPAGFKRIFVDLTVNGQETETE